MRDDVLTLFGEAAALLSRKKRLFEHFISGENEKIILLNAGKTEKCMRMLRDDDDLIAEIDSIDFSIRSIEDRIAGIIGVKPSKLDGYLSGRDETVIREILAAKKDIARAAAGLAGLRERTVGLLETALGRTAEEIDGLRSIARIKDSGILKKL